MTPSDASGTGRVKGRRLGGERVDQPVDNGRMRLRLVSALFLALVLGSAALAGQNRIDVVQAAPGS